jgi:hypothetical protein
MEQLYGPEKGRDAHIERAKTRLCRDCYLASEAEGHVELVGSEKQVRWAISIRKAWLRDIADLEGDVRRTVEADPEGASAALALLEEHRQEAEAQPSASWWIDHRDRDLQRECLATLIERGVLPKEG